MSHHSNSWNWPLSGGTPCTSQLALIRGLLGAVRLSEMACGASVSQTVKLTKGAFLPRGPGDTCLGREKGLMCFNVCVHIMHIVYGVYVFISMLGSKTTQSCPRLSNPTHPARPKLNPHNMM